MEHTLYLSFAALVGIVLVPLVCEQARPDVTGPHLQVGTGIT